MNPSTDRTIAPRKSAEVSSVQPRRIRLGGRSVMAASSSGSSPARAGPSREPYDARADLRVSQVVPRPPEGGTGL